MTATSRRLTVPNPTLCESAAPECACERSAFWWGPELAPMPSCWGLMWTWKIDRWSLGPGAQVPRVRGSDAASPSRTKSLQR